jgi:hypothetical protein
MSARGGWGAVLLLGLAGCGTTDVNLGYNDQPVVAGECPGGEVVHWPFGWDEPVWLWFGPESQAPECPGGSTTYEGHADLVAPMACEACTCEPPTGACSFSLTITASSETCGAFGSGAMTPFAPPASWDGQCDGSTGLPQGAAHAVTIGPLGMTEDECVPGPTLPAKAITWHWETFGRACDGFGWTPGPLERSACVPDAETELSGFRLCAVRLGEHDCPTWKDNVFTERHVFFEGVDDPRACSACTCGPPAGSLCTATISLYKGGDKTCDDPVFAQIPASSAGPACIDIQPPGQALGGKSAGALTYTAGTCQPLGGEPNGLAATGTEPVTFCCRP